MKKFAQWLIQILEPQLRADLRGTEFKAESLRSRINLRNWRTVVSEPQLRNREDDEIHFRFRRPQDEGRSINNCQCRIAKSTPRRRQFHRADGKYGLAAITVP